MLRRVGCCWPKSEAPAKRSQHANATCRNIVGRNMLRAFGHRVAMCCDMLGVVGSNLKMVKFEPTTPNMSQHGGQTHATCCAQQCRDMLRWHVAIVCMIVRIDRSQHANATYRNIVGGNMLRAFGHPALLRHVATCWVLLAQIWPFSNLSQQHPTRRNTSQQGGQTHATCCAQQCCDMLKPRPNDHNMST